MSHYRAEQVLETIAEDVEKMSTGSILQELEGGMNPGVCESWDMRVAMTDRNNVIEALIEKRFTEGY